MPFYEGLLLKKRKHTICNLFRKGVTPKRKDYILMILSPKSKPLKRNWNFKVSGMPYIRTLNANSITGEISLLSEHLY
jgi:hypothetical protein